LQLNSELQHGDSGNPEALSQTGCMVHAISVSWSVQRIEREAELEASGLFRIGFLFDTPDHRETASLSLQSVQLASRR